MTDKGYLGDLEVVDVARSGPWVLHRLERPAPFTVGERVRGKVDVPRRTQLMQHHTATHLLNGALREVLGPHVWQTGAYKGPESARIDITHYRALSKEELHKVERRVNEVVREDRPVKSYFETRGEAERRFGFTLYQGGAVPWPGPSDRGGPRFRCRGVRRNSLHPHERGRSHRDPGCRTDPGRSGPTHVRERGAGPRRAGGARSDPARGRPTGSAYR